MEHKQDVTVTADRLLLYCPMNLPCQVSTFPLLTYERELRSDVLHDILPLSIGVLQASDSDGIVVLDVGEVGLRVPGPRGVSEESTGDRLRHLTARSRRVVTIAHSRSGIQRDERFSASVVVRTYDEVDNQCKKYCLVKYKGPKSPNQMK